MAKVVLVLAVLVLCVCVHSQIMPGQERNIPLSVYKQLAKLGVQSKDDFERLFMDEVQYKEETELRMNYTAGNETDTGNSSRTHIGSGRPIVRTRSGGVEEAVNDPCSPRPSTVMIPSDGLQAFEMQWPMCTKINRCGGCCATTQYACRPTATNKKLVAVRRYSMRAGGGDFNGGGETHVLLEEHLACEQQCRVQAKDCTIKQNYNPNECMCQCKSGVLECDYNIKYFDHSTCACECTQKDRNCPNRMTAFSDKTCRCEASTDISGKIDIDKVKVSGGSGTKVETKVVVPDVPDVPDQGTVPDSGAKPVPVVTKPSGESGERKVDCSGKRCPPGFKAAPGLDGTCSCKPNFG